MQDTFLIRSFGRLRGKNKNLKYLPTLPQYELTKENFDRISQNTPISLEVGFGGGDFLIHNALLLPNTHFIGCEPFLNGINNVLNLISENNLQNIYIWPDDVRKIIYDFPDNIFDNIYVLFPDPWPKTRNHKRRLISQTFIETLSKKIIPSGEIIIATDHEGYYSWIHKILSNQQLLTFDYKKNITPSNWCDTKYYRFAKAKGHNIHIFTAKHI